MEMKIDEKINPLFNRKDLGIHIKHGGLPTPSKGDLTKELSSKYNVDPSQVVINYVFSQKGSNEAFIKCKILNEKPKEKPAQNPPVQQEVKNDQTQASSAT